MAGQRRSQPQGQRRAWCRPRGGNMCSSVSIYICIYAYTDFNISHYSQVMCALLKHNAHNFGCICAEAQLPYMFPCDLCFCVVGTVPTKILFFFHTSINTLMKAYSFNDLREKRPASIPLKQQNHFHSLSA